MKTYLALTVYRSSHYEKEGFLSASDIIYVRHDKGPIKEEQAPEHLRFYLKKRKDYWFAVPVKGSGYMEGGTLAYTSDSRLPHVVHIHDRKEGAS